MTSRLQSQFRVAVVQCVERYLHGFEISEESQWSLLASSDATYVRVGCNTSNVTYVECWLAPLAGTSGNLHLPEQPELPARLADVLRCVAPELPDTEVYPKPLMLGLSISREVERQFRLISQHCAELVAGTRDAWLNTLECLRSRYFGPYPGERLPDYFQRLVAAADSAWASHRYWDVQTAYMKLLFYSEGLTLKQRFRLWYASRHTFLMR